MLKRDTSDVLCSVWAFLADAAAVFGGMLLATWLRFDSGWFAVARGRHPNLYATYLPAAGIATVLFLFIFGGLRLYTRPQIGRFEGYIPRIVRACGLGLVLAMVVAFSLQNVVELSRLTIGIGFVTVTVLVLLERYILFRIELHYARHSRVKNRVLILGVDAVAAHIMRGLRNEPKFRSQVIGFLRTDGQVPDADVPPELIAGDMEAFHERVERGDVDQVILADASLGHDRIVELILFCERHLVTFNMVPDLFRILTANMAVQSIDDIPLLGVSSWPLDKFWNRALKRLEDVGGALAGLMLTAPVIAAAAYAIRRAEPGGPVFYSQERCGENGRAFRLYKLRTMRQNAEAETGPVFTVRGDPRTTPVGAFLRRHNIDELPQLWNVLKGDMSLVGPRPERPHFVEKFREGVQRYMWRHVSKPGLTGWAQVNGLRGNTSIEERIKYDLYYLENWSLSFDFKILMMTLFAHENAY